MKFHGHGGGCEYHRRLLAHGWDGGSARVCALLQLPDDNWRSISFVFACLGTIVGAIAGAAGEQAESSRVPVSAPPGIADRCRSDDSVKGSQLCRDVTSDDWRAVIIRGELKAELARKDGSDGTVRAQGESIAIWVVRGGEQS